MWNQQIERISGVQKCTIPTFCPGGRADRRKKKGPFLLRNGASWTSLKGDAGPQQISYMQPSRCILHHDLAVWSPDDCNTAKVWTYGGSWWDTCYSACENLPTAMRSRILCGSLLKVESSEMCKWIRWAAQFTFDSQKQEGVEGNVEESPFKNGLDWSWQAPPRYLKCHRYKYTHTEASAHANAGFILLKVMERWPM